MFNRKIFLKIFTCILTIVMVFPSAICAESSDLNTPTIVIHAGEYPGKQGKRSFIADEIKNLDTNIYKTENGGTELGEFYLNKPICQKVAKYIRKGDSRINVIEFYSKDRSTDLNAAGRKAVSYKPDMYLAIHHNCTTNGRGRGSARGFICMTAQGRYKYSSERVAQNIAKSMKSVSDRTGLPQFIGFKDGNWKNNTYVGEMNECNAFCPTVLIEVAFFDNLDDLHVSTNASKNDLIAKSIAVAILREFHSGNFDNDQPGEQQDTTMKGAEKVTLSETKKQVEYGDDKNKNKPDKTLSKVELLKHKVRLSGKHRLGSNLPTSRFTNFGRTKIKSLLDK